MFKLLWLTQAVVRVAASSLPQLVQLGYAVLPHDARPDAEGTQVHSSECFLDPEEVAGEVRETWRDLVLP